MSLFRNHRLHELLALGVVALAGCSSQPVPPAPAPTTSDLGSDSHSVSDSASATTPQPETSETETGTPTVDTGTGSSSTNGTAASDSGTGSSTGTVATSVDSDTVQYCPFLCQDDIGAATCSALGDHWVRNAGFLCEDPAQLCCQALGQPDGVSESCAEQPALTCRSGCGGSMIQRTDYFCDDANKVCCEDPSGPTCTEMAGKCLSFIESCPAGYSSSNLPCGSFVDKCCAPPICPWDCTAYDGEKTCSDKTVNPTAVRNDQYACPVKGDICCQPIGAEDGLEEKCADQQQMVCRETCESNERANDAYYCPTADRACCEDTRPKCIEDLGGKCVLPLLGCDDGMEKSDRGVCLGAESMDCCVNAAPLNQCADQGGTCVAVGKSCPLLHTPDLTTWCGTLTDICCKPLF